MLSIGVLAAQRAEESWDNLGTLEAGQKIRLIRTNLKPVEGSFSEFSKDAIVLRSEGGQMSVARAEVFRVTLRERSNRLRNSLIGMAIGAGAGLAVGAAIDSSASESGENLGKTIFTPIGLGVGAGLGAATGGFPTVYRGKLPKR